MDLEITRNIFFWCTIINFGTLAFWGILMVAPHQWLHRYTNLFCRVSAEQFDGINLAGIVLYKILIILFNLVPYIALPLIVG